MKKRPVNLDELEAVILERARTGLAPSVSARSRALSAISAGLSLPPASLQVGLSSPGSAAGSAGRSGLIGSSGVNTATASAAGSAGSSGLIGSSGVNTAVQLAGGAAKLGATWGVLFLKATLAGLAAGVVLGTGAYVVTSNPSAPSSPSLRAPAAVTTASSVSTSQSEPRLSPGTTPSGSGAESSAPKSADPFSTRMKVTAASQAPERLAPRPRRDPTSWGPAASVVAASSPARELAALREAQSALGRGDGALALHWMRQLDKTDSNGALSAERTVTRVLALCQLGRADDATAVARRAIGDDATLALYGKRFAASCAEIDAGE